MINEEKLGFASDNYEPLVGVGSGDIGDDQGLDFLGSEFTGS